MNPIGNRSDGPRRLIRCLPCGRAIECSAATLLKYTREGWPRCCGQVMAFVTEPVGYEPAAAEPRPLPEGA